MYRAHSDAFLSIVAAKMAVIHNQLRVCTETSKGVLGTSWPKMAFSMHGLVAGSAILDSPDFPSFSNADLHNQLRVCTEASKEVLGTS